ncbi:MAG: DUF4910 domain-containing protein [Bacteroidetes bacterium]|jgi:aminopeptidase YwaD|nr:DUF4910 domain-containing protein [Bacteroidota bacterium]MBT6686986.1 DUF4910 domain-containing protein [Bacteroidota bacterium]MBT7142412.1 DUF4910 domain-containing protein [Bacteroidota bacterium]MBT7490593.1 DUF4910 domain-containing protein [Bacteroidota bacterium]
MKKHIFPIILILFSLSAFNQDIEYARQIISELCSENFRGRGYEKNGDKKAAKFIRNELISNKLQKFDDDYFQEFSFSINTFPSAISVKIDKNELVPGVDYLVGSQSNSCKGKFPIAWINKKVVNHRDALFNMLSNDLSNYFLAIDTVGIHRKDVLELIEIILDSNVVNAKGIIEIADKKLVYRKSQTEKKFPLIQIKRGKIGHENKFISVNIKNKYIENYTSRNVIAYVKGKTDSFIVFSSHYDHLGMMGKSAYFPGANDNASGVAMNLDLAKYYSGLPENPHYSYAFMFFSGEEEGILGSKYYVNSPFFDLSQIKILINLDMVGDASKGIKIVNGKVFENEYQKFVEINEQNNYLKKVSSRGAAANSDHYYFYDAGVKSFFIYSIGEYKEYHNINDKSEDLPLSGYEDLFRLLRDYTLDFKVN